MLSAIFDSPHLIASFAYLIVLVGVGVWKARSVKGSEDFMVAGRTLHWTVLVGTLLATWIGSGSLFSGAGLGYRNGPSGLWMSAGAWLGIVFVFFIAKRIRNFGKITVPDIFEARYGTAAATLAMLTTIVAYITIVSYQFKGGGKILSILTEGGITPEAGIVITAVFAVTYTVLAGMLSVVYTDVANGVLMTFGVIFSLGWLVHSVGGMDEVIAAAEAAGKWRLFGNWAGESDSGASAPILALSMFVPTMLLLLGDANMYQRIFSARNARSARKAVFFWVIGVVILESSINFLGLAGSVAAEQGQMTDLAAKGLATAAANPELSARAGMAAATELVIPTLSMELLPTGLGMLLVATMLAIVVSTADSFLLVPATNLTRDVYQRWFKPDASDGQVVRVSRIMVLVLGVVAYLLVDQFPTILSAAYTAYLIYGASITPSLLAAFLWKRATKQGAIASILTGAFVTIAWTFWIDTSSFHPMLAEVTYPAASLSIVALIVVSLATPPPPASVWGKFLGGPEANRPERKAQTMSFYELEPNALSGTPRPLKEFAGSVSLVVNVASECGYTPQYAGLQTLHDELKSKGFQVLGFPSNEFGQQEPGDGSAIRAFCTKNFGVDFPLFEKCKTQMGDGQSPIYTLLGDSTGQLPAWNFAKYLVNRDGVVVKHYESGVAPDDASLRADIDAAIG
tara:strand:- start:56 stop:2107 length:2052 start_codon:yes stop_codon:yes gene_type:complete